MKKVLILIIVYMLSTACAVLKPSYVPKSDLESDNIKGPVARITECTYDVIGKTFDDPSRTSAFDLKLVIDYNDKGNITTMRLYSLEDGAILTTDTMIYEKNGTRLTMHSRYDHSGNTEEIFRYKYESNGKFVEETDITGAYKTITTRNKKGYPIKVVSTRDDKVLTTTEYIYDRKGRLLSEKVDNIKKDYLYRNGVLYKEVYDNSLSVIYYPDGNIQFMDMNIKVNLEEGDEMMFRQIEAVYEYDERGNWVRRERSSEGKMLHIDTREIEYRDR